MAESIEGSNKDEAEQSIDPRVARTMNLSSQIKNLRMRKGISRHVGSDSHILEIMDSLLDGVLNGSDGEKMSFSREGEKGFVLNINDTLREYEEVIDEKDPKTKLSSTGARSSYIIESEMTETKKGEI